MFTYLWQHIRRFFKLDQTNYLRSSIPVFRTSTATYTPYHLLRIICEVDAESREECRVKTLTWYKERKTSEHQFIVAALTDSVYLRVERRPSSNANPLTILSTPTHSSLDEPIETLDIIKLFTNPRDLKRNLSSRSVEIVTALTFSNFPVLEFSRLLCAISDYRPNYVINTTMCVWYASATMNLAPQLFEASVNHKSRGKGGGWKGIRFDNEKRGFEAIQMSFIQAHDAIPNPVGISISRDRRKREAERDKERREAEEREQQLLEQVEEERRKAAEVRLLKEKAELELERYKAMAAHRGGH